MSHYTLCAIAQIDSKDTYEKFKKLCESNKEYLIDFFTKKLEKPLLKFDINDQFCELNGRFDLWTIFDILPIGKFPEHLIELDRMPQAILLPNLEWIESEEAFYSVSESNEKEYDKWVNKLKEIVSSYDNALIVLIDCHI